MKIRIKGNSIRLRLSKSEIDRFAEKKILEEKTEFGSTTFYYELLVDMAVNALSARFEEHKISVLVPPAIHQEWTSTARVGFDHKMKIGEEKQLFILIEKDFVCLDHTLEDQSDNFPNPNKQC